MKGTDAINQIIIRVLALVKEGKPEEAVKILKFASEQAPDNISLIYHLGFVYRSINDFDKAEECYRKALVLAPQNADVYCALGVVYQQKKDFEASVEHLEKAIGLNRNLINAYNSLGYTFNSMGEWEKALDIYQKGIDVLKELFKKEDKPLKGSLDYAVLCNNMATVLAESGEMEQAEKMFEESIAFIPEGAVYPAPHRGLEKLRS